MQCHMLPRKQKKRDNFDHTYIKKFCPRQFDQFVFSHPNGAFGGILIIWNGEVFTGQLLHNLSFALTVEFTSVHLLEKWSVTCIYGPCENPT